VKIRRVLCKFWLLGLVYLRWRACNDPTGDPAIEVFPDSNHITQATTVPTMGMSGGDSVWNTPGCLKCPDDVTHIDMMIPTNQLAVDMAL